MALPSNYSPDKSIGNGTSTIFTGTWSPLSAEYFKVRVESILTGIQTLVDPSNYTMVFDDDGYTLNMNVAPSSSYYLIRSREVTQDQTNPYTTSRGYQGEVIERSFDKVTAITQDLRDDVSRSLTLPLGSSVTDISLGEANNRGLAYWDGPILKSDLTSIDDINDITTNVAAAVVTAQAAASTSATNAVNANNSAVAAAASAASIPAALASKADLASPTFTGIPKAPTAAPGTNTTQIATTAFVLAASGSSAVTANLIVGFEPETFSTNVIRFTAGAVANAGLAPTTMLVYNSSNYISVDLSTIGLNGMDVGPAVPTSNDTIQFYVVKHTTNGTVGILASRSITYAGVTYPSGYSQSLARKLRFAVIYRATTTGGPAYGLPDFHLDNWPYTPEINFSNWRTDGTWDVLSAGTNTVGADIDFTGFVPNAARMLRYQYELRPNGATGDAVLYVNGTGSAPKKIASVLSGGAPFFYEGKVRLSSGRTVQYANSSATLRSYMRPLGYIMTEWS